MCSTQNTGKLIVKLLTADLGLIIIAHISVLIDVATFFTQWIMLSPNGVFKTVMSHLLNCYKHPWARSKQLFNFAWLNMWQNTQPATWHQFGNRSTDDWMIGWLTKSNSLTLNVTFSERTLGNAGFIQYLLVTTPSWSSKIKRCNVHQTRDLYLDPTTYWFCDVYGS